VRQQTWGNAGTGVRAPLPGIAADTAPPPHHPSTFAGRDIIKSPTGAGLRHGWLRHAAAANAPTSRGPTPFFPGTSPTAGGEVHSSAATLTVSGNTSPTAPPGRVQRLTTAPLPTAKTCPADNNDHGVRHQHAGATPLQRDIGLHHCHQWRGPDVTVTTEPLPSTGHVLQGGPGGTGTPGPSLRAPAGFLGFRAAASPSSGWAFFWTSF